MAKGRVTKGNRRVESSVIGLANVRQEISRLTHG